MQELRDSLNIRLKKLNKTVNEFNQFGRNDKSVIYDVYSSEFNSLINYLDSKSLPIIFKKHELRILLNKIGDELSDLRELLNCYSEINKRKDKLNSDFDIVDKNTVLFHHLEDLIYTMELFLGYDKIEKYKTLEGFFDQIIVDIRDQKIAKRNNFEQKLLDLKSNIEDSHFKQKDGLLKEIDLLLEDLKSYERVNEKKAFLIKQKLDQLYLQFRKKNLQKSILKSIHVRLLENESIYTNDNLPKNFDDELERIKKAVKAIEKE